MRATSWLLTAVICLVLTTGSAIADEDAAVEASPEANRARALAEGMHALKLRVEAAMKRAALLEKAGKAKEALAVYESVESMYVEGLDALRRLVAGSGARAGSQPAISDTPFAQGVPAAPKGDALKAAIFSGLDWLARNQRSDGSFLTDDTKRPVYRTGLTALATLAFLRAGYTHQGNHAWNQVVGKALDHLTALQDPEGCFGARSTPYFIYNHAFATLAVVEAYAQTRSAVLRPVVQKAMDFSAKARNPYFGWRYGVKPGDNDTSVTHWMLAGIHAVKALNEEAAAAGKAPPFSIDEGAHVGALAWVDKMTDPDYGRVGYILRGSGSARPRELVDKFPAEHSEAMTAAGVHIRLMAGQDAAADLVQKGQWLMSRLPPLWQRTGGRIDMYYWYLGALAMEKLGGPRWAAWRKALIAATVPNQRKPDAPEGLRGSWDPVGPWGVDGGRVYSTSMMLLALEVAQGTDGG